MSARDTPGVLNLARWVSRLGWKREDEPVVIYNVQPVSLVHDGRDLASAVLAPSGFVGGVTLGVALEFGVFQFQARRDVRVRFFAGSAAFAYGIEASPQVLTGAVPVQLNQYVPDFPFLSQPQVGTSVAAGFNDGTRPQHQQLAAHIPLFVPSGSWLVGVSVVVNQAMTWELGLTELPEDHGA